MLFKKYFFRTFSIQIVVILMVTIVIPVYSVSALSIELTENARPLSDPSLSWNTFLGGKGYDTGSDILVDELGNIYVIGTSSGYYIDSNNTLTNPTWGNPKRAYGGGESDAFVAKLNSSGALIWNTFLGGLGSDVVGGIVVDGNGSIYVTGNSSSSWGSPIQAHNNNSTDGFIVKLNSSGALIWNTFLGGNGLVGIDLDVDGNIYLTGSSANDWTTPDSPLHNHSGNWDAFVVKMTPSGSLIWHTFLGGSAQDMASAIVVGGDNSIYVVGTSYSGWGNPVLPYIVSPFWNPFIAKLNLSGTLVWNTFLGAGRDRGFDIAIDADANVYVVGVSSSTWGNPVRAFDDNLPLSNNGFAAKLNSVGTLIWNTFLGNDGDDANGINVDDNGHVYVVGTSCNSWENPFRAISVCADAFIAKLDGSGNLLTNGFLGGSGSDGGGKIYVNGDGNAYMIGNSDEGWGNPVRSYSKDFDENTRDSDVFVARLNLAIPVLKVLSIVRADTDPTNSLTVNFMITFSNTVSGVDVTDFALTTSGVSGATVSEVSSLGNIYTVKITTGNGDGTIRLDIVDNDSIVDINSKPLGGIGIGNGGFTKGETYTIDKTAPTISSIARMNSNSSAAIFVNFLVTFSEPISTVDVSDFSLNTTEIVGATVSSVSGTGATRIVKVNTGSGDGSIRLDAIDNDTILDLASNPLNGGFTSGEVYTIDKPNLLAPVLRSPGTNVVTNDTTPTLWWAFVKGGVTYEIEVASDNTFETKVDTNVAGGLSHTVAVALIDGTYFWRVRAYNASNQPGIWSSTRTFTIDTSGPTAPALSSPADGVSLTRTPIFKWFSSLAAILYEFQYDTDLNFTSPTKYTVTTRGTFRRPPAMKVGTYYWRVRAKDASGNWGVWSISREINIISP